MNIAFKMAKQNHKFSAGIEVLLKIDPKSIKQNWFYNVSK